MNRRLPLALASFGLVAVLTVSTSPLPAAAADTSNISIHFSGPPDPTVGNSQGGTLTFSEAASGTPAGGALAALPVDPCYTGAYHLKGQVPIPPFGIGKGPPEGIVNIPTWFWTSGYSGGIVKSRTVEVTRHVCVGGTPDDLDYFAQVDLWPYMFTWSWGDGDSHGGQCPDMSNPGEQLDAGLADLQWIEDVLDAAAVPDSCTQAVMGQKDQPFVTHTYDASSVGKPSGVIVTLEIHFKGKIGLDTGDGINFHWISLDDLMSKPIPLQHASTYLPVREMESILVPAPGT